MKPISCFFEHPSDNMRANSILTWAILVLASLVTAVPAHRDSQKEASKEIMKLQDKGNSYVTKTIKHRESGCTADKILYRQEWYGHILNFRNTIAREARLISLIGVRCGRRLDSNTSKPSNASARKPLSALFRMYRVQEVVMTTSVPYTSSRPPKYTSR